jgi:hypothetical protein
MTSRKKCHLVIFFELNYKIEVKQAKTLLHPDDDQLGLENLQSISSIKFVRQNTNESN